MIEDVEVRLAKQNIVTKETREGKMKQVIFVLKGLDKINHVEWSVTLKAENEMPSCYLEAIGNHIGNTSMANIGKSTQQTEL